MHFYLPVSPRCLKVCPEQPNEVIFPHHNLSARKPGEVFRTLKPLSFPHKL
uniref:Uncharacterized protein n=1 Tax=Anguilla anguilla TaxID=7936 RepID=A0A0E9P9F7_ANGAN